MKDLTQKRFFLLDMDGTIYIDHTLFDGTLDFLSHVRESGGKYLFLTNNSSKSAEDYAKKLRALGIPSDGEDFLTATDATTLYLEQHYPDALVYAMGTRSFVDELREGGIRVTTELVDGIDLLLISNDTELTFKKLEDACILLGRGVTYIATNPDYVCPTAYGYAPDCGSFAEILCRATGRMPLFIGKPEPAMLNLALKKYRVPAEDALMVGDRLYTDIAAGVNAGVDTVLVLSGEGTREEAEKSEKKPTYILENIRALDNAVFGTHT